MAKNRSRDGTSFEEALRMSAIQAPALQRGDDDDEDTGYGDEDEPNEESDPDLADLNNPDVEALSEAPVIGSRPKNSDMFGLEAETFGRATSPKLYAQAAQFPSAVQFRVWRWENGIPVALGAIDAEANEEEFVRQFKDAMPKPGEGRFQFRLRPIDIRGVELGKEFTINISEHHATLKQLRERKMREEEEERLDRYDRGMMGMAGMNGWGGGGGRQGDIIVNPPPGPSHDAGTTYAEEMGRMFEQAVESAERRTEVLQTTLEQERDRLRDEENRRAQERISMAEKSADIVQKMTEKLMASDRMRADEAMKAQRDHGQLLLGTLTTVFQQQQEASRQQTERMREVDMARMSQDREFFERQRMEMEMRRGQEREDEERRRMREKEEWERRREEDRHRLEMEAKRIEEQRRYELEQLRLEAERREQEIERRREIEKEDIRARMERERAEIERRERELERQREHEKQEFERKRQQEKDEWALRLERERQEVERREREMERIRETEREQNRLWLERERQEMARRESDIERKRELEKEELRARENEAERRREAERIEAERRREIEREEIRARVEREKLEAHRLQQQMLEERERWRQEMEDKRRAETMEWERKQAAEREERERRERTDRERWEREKLEMSQRLERERIEWERKEAIRREELSREEARRKDEMLLQQKAIEIAAQRDREHAERMLEMARIEREAQREAQNQREKAEREARELAEKDRQRQHELTMREMEIAKERDREHAERMLQLSKQQSTGGLSGITEMLGMETPELLARIFGTGGGDEDEEGEKKSPWMEMIPKVLGAVAEVGKAAMVSQSRGPAVDPRVAAAGMGQQQVAIQTPEGIKLIPASMLSQMNMDFQAQQAQRQREPVRVQAPPPGYTSPSQRRRMREEPPREVIDMPEFDESTDNKVEEAISAALSNPPAPELSAEFQAAEEVNTIKRAKEAKMPLPKQKAARKAIRELGEKLAKAEESEWSGMVTEAIMAEFAIYTYIKAVSVYAALAEAKIEPALAERIVKALRESGMIPEDVPFTESDWVRLNSAETKEEEVSNENQD